MNTLIDILTTELEAYDGKAVTLLSETRKRHALRDGFCAALIHILASANAQTAEGASWILLRELENGHRLDDKDTAVLIATLPTIASWQTELHICQMAEYLTLQGDQISDMTDWLHPLMSHKRPFLRAWSANALVCLAAKHAALRTRAYEALDAADADTAASVRARARKVRAHLDKSCKS